MCHNTTSVSKFENKKNMYMIVREQCITTEIENICCTLRVSDYPNYVNVVLRNDSKLFSKKNIEV